MKRLFALLVVASLLPIHSAAVRAEEASPYEHAIEYLREQGIAEGYADGTFRPFQSINRAEFTKIITLAHADDMGSMRGSFCFSDVHAQWFAPYVCSAKDHRMVSGYPDGSFKPERAISFAEAASLMMRAHDPHMTSGYGDAWYMPYMHALEEMHAVPPTVRGMHEPLTRGEMAYIIWKMDGGDNDNDDDEYEDEEDINVTIHTAQHTVAAGESVTVSVMIENDGNDDVEVDVDVTLPTGLSALSAPGNTSLSAGHVRWSNLDVDEDDEETLTLIAVADAGLAAGTRLTIQVEAEDEEDDLSLTIGSVPTTPTPPSAMGDPVLHWNAIALQANADDHTGTFGQPENMGPGGSTRTLAMVHAAMYDAAVSVDREYQPFTAYLPIEPSERVNMDAAVAAAAYNTLVALYPSQKSLFDSSYHAHIRSIPEGQEKSSGLRVGQQAAEQILAAREDDGAHVVTPFTPSTLPGRHRVDPMNPAQPPFLGSTWGAVKPFAIAASWQFRAPPPPAITSTEYAEAFNEVKNIGADGIKNPTTRTEDQTEIALFWAYDGVPKIGTPPRLYNQITRVIAMQKGNTVLQNARLFALVNIAMADAAIVCWESKKEYDYWRPVLAIREADEGAGPSQQGDGNPLTTGDADWEPLGSPASNSHNSNFTPPFPAYPSGHSTMGAATFRTIANFYGTDEIPFTFTSDELNGITTDNKGIIRPLAPRSFRRLSDASKENAVSRVYQGVHWRFDTTAGMDMGISVADHVYSRVLRPAR